MELHVATIAVSSQDTAIWHRIQPAICWQWVKCGARNKATLTNTHLQDKLTTRFMEELQLQRAIIRTWDAIGNSHSTQWAISSPASSTPMMATAVSEQRGSRKAKWTSWWSPGWSFCAQTLTCCGQTKGDFSMSNRRHCETQCRKLKQRHPVSSVPVISVLLSGNRDAGYSAARAWFHDTRSSHRRGSSTWPGRGRMWCVF